MKLLTGNSNKSLSQKISKHLKTKLVHSSIKKFADGEIYIEINENIRGNSVFVVQSTSNPANDNLMELLLVIDALKRSSAKTVTASRALTCPTEASLRRRVWSVANLAARSALRQPTRSRQMPTTLG